MDNNRTAPGIWMQTFTGVQCHLPVPKQEEINIEDIAHALALQCRFNGHTRSFYSVAQHSVLVSECAGIKEEYRLTALLHDAAEAYIGDMIRPLKIGTFCGQTFQMIETAIMAAIRFRFDLKGCEECAEQIEISDLVILATEKRDLLGPSPAEWGVLPDPKPWSIIPWGWSHAEQVFLARFEDLRKRNGMPPAAA